MDSNSPRSTAGSSPIPRDLREDSGFAYSKTDLMLRIGVDDRTVDDWLEILLWALARNAEEAGRRVAGTATMWVAVREDNPRLRIYYRIIESEDLVLLKWIEEDAG